MRPTHRAVLALCLLLCTAVLSAQDVPIRQGPFTVTMGPQNNFLPAGTSYQFYCVRQDTQAYTQFLSDGIIDLTTSGTWSTSDSTIAYFQPGTGILQTLTSASNPITVFFSSGPYHLSTSLTVGPAAVSSITLGPVLNPSIAVSGQQTFTATAQFTDGSSTPVTGAAVWSSNDTTVATTSGATVTGVADGTTFINAAYTDPYYGNVVTGTTGINVGLAASNPIVVSPTPVTVALGQTQQFTAMGNFTDLVQRNVSGAVTWGSSNTAVAITDQTGFVTTASAGGPINITAASGAASGSASLTVGPLMLLFIAVTPSSANLDFGNSLQFAATGNYSDGSSQDLTVLATWMSSDATVATMSPNGPFGGLATANSNNNANTAQITAQYTDPNYSGNIQTSSASLSVGPPTLVSITVSPSNPTLVAGTTQQFTATGQYDDGSTADLTASASWSSDTQSVATVATTGLVTAVSPGGANISATDLGTSITGSAAVTVISAQVTSIDVSPPNATLNVGMQQQYTATGHYSDQSTHDITAVATWGSSMSAFASINPGGLATADKAGTTSISAQFNGVTSNSATLNVNAPTLTTVTVTPASVSANVNDQIQFTATATFNDNSSQDITSTATWIADNTGCSPACIAVNNTAGSKGLAVALHAGTAKVIATQASQSGNASLTVTGAVLQSITIAPLNYTLPRNLTKQFRATGHYSDGSTRDLTASVSPPMMWSSSQTFVATISSAGLVTAKNIGSTTITATIVSSGAHSASTKLNVTF